MAYGATDDFGVAKVIASIQVTREGGAPETEARPVFELAAGADPETVRRGRYALDLASLRLQKGDQVMVVLVATDFRGELPGKSASSDPLVFHVTDERGVLAAMMDSDERSARQLDAIIERQLGIGESK